MLVCGYACDSCPFLYKTNAGELDCSEQSWQLGGRMHFPAAFLQRCPVRSPALRSLHALDICMAKQPSTDIITEQRRSRASSRSSRKGQRMSTAATLRLLHLLTLCTALHEHITGKITTPQKPGQRGRRPFARCASAEATCLRPPALRRTSARGSRPAGRSGRKMRSCARSRSCARAFAHRP